MAVVTRYLIERNGELITDSEGNYLMHVDKAQADAIDRKLDAIETLAVMMSEQEIKGIDYDVGFKLAEALVDRAAAWDKRGEKEKAEADRAQARQRGGG